MFHLTFFHILCCRAIDFGTTWVFQTAAYRCGMHKSALYTLDIINTTIMVLLRSMGSIPNNHAFLLHGTLYLLLRKAQWISEIKMFLS